MYKSYFGFSESPFENNLDQRFLFFSANHKEITAALLYFIKWKKGFALVCGDVGTGKTMLINYLLSKLPASVHPIMIANPDVGYVEILRYVAGILKIDAKGKRVLELVDHVKAALMEASRRGEHFVLIIDEAHLLPDRSIEQIRLLSNIETQEHKLFQILLLGQYELSYKLDRPEMRQLRQRININRFLAPMDAAETTQYIDHRLKMAGASFDACFEPHCRPLIFKMTNGVPRSINQLCDCALLVCKAEKLQKVDRRILKKAATALRSDILFTPRPHARGSASSWQFIKPLPVFGACAIILILLGISGYGGRLGEKVQFFLHRLYPTVWKSPVAIRLPISEPAANPGTPPAAIKPAAHDSAKMPGPVIDTASEITMPSSSQMPSGRQSPENFDQERDARATLPEMKQTLQTKTISLPREKTGDLAASPPPAEKEIQSVKKASLLHDPKKLEVKNGDTLFGIASRFFPENKVEGVKKIIAANPMIDDMYRIYPGQKLIIPGIVLIEKDSN